MRLSEPSVAKYVAAAAATGVVVVLLHGAVAAGAAVVDAGFRDYSYGKSVSAPTSKEVQSKLWFNAGSWWAVLWNPAPRRYQIFRLDARTQAWIATGVTVDARGTVRSDVLWDGRHLYIASAGTKETVRSQAPKVRRFSYSRRTRTYSLDKGFPVSVDTGGGMEAFVIDEDTTGTVWGTYTRQAKVWVTHTRGRARTWVRPRVVPSPGATTIKAEDESGVVAYNGHIGIMWSNQNDGTYYWAVHRDGDPETSWQISFADRGTGQTDNHINLKALNHDRAGQVFAVVKTSQSHPLGDILYELLVLGNDGAWHSYGIGRVIDSLTRAVVLLDPHDRRIYVAMASPCCSGGVIYYKVSSLDAISFDVGRGTPLIKSDRDAHINNVSATKQRLSSVTGLAVIAADDTSRFYVHNEFGIGAGDKAPPRTTIDAGPGPTAYTSSATFSFTSNENGSRFSCRVDGGPFAPCASPMSYGGLADGAHTFQVRATDLSGNSDPTSASRTWTVDTSNPTMVVAADSDAEVDASDPDRNLASSSAIAVDGAPLSEAYLRFSVSGVAGAVLDARLKLYVTNGALLGPVLYAAAGGWSEAGITWNTRPRRIGSPLTVAGAIARNTWVEYDVTSTVTGNGSYTFELAPTSDDAVVFLSRESPANPPQLVLTIKASARHEARVESVPVGLQSAARGSLAPPGFLASTSVRQGSTTDTDESATAGSQPAAFRRVFDDGFEAGGLSSWEVTTGGGGSANVQSACVRTGQYAARLSATSDPGSLAFARRSLGSPQTDVTVRGDFEVQREGAPRGNVPLIRLFGGDGSRVVSLYRQNAAKNRLYVSYGGAYFVTAGKLALDTWGALELRVITAGDGAGTVEVSFDGRLVYDATALDRRTGGILTVQLGNQRKAQAFALIADDIATWVPPT